jgi:hypothetical protein
MLSKRLKEESCGGKIFILKNSINVDAFLNKQKYPIIVFFNVILKTA